MTTRVAFILGPFPNISETFIQRQIIGLLKLGVDVHLFPEKRGNGKIESRLKNRVHYKQGFQHLRSKISPQHEILERIRNFGDFEIIHTHFGHIAAKYAGLKNILPETKSAITFHGYDANVAPKIQSNLYKKIISEVDLVTVNSTFLKTRVHALGFPQKKIIKLPVAIEFDQYKFSPEKNTTLSFISIGRLHKAKGFKYSIQAFMEFSKIFPSATYTIIGDGAQKSTLQKLAENKKIKFMGSKTSHEIYEILNSHNILLMPSIVTERGDEETQGVVLQESQAAGLLYIASDIGGIKEGASPNSGIFVHQKNSNVIYESMLRLQKKRSEWEPLQKEAREFVRTRYDLPILSQKLHDAYLSILEK